MAVTSYTPEQSANAKALHEKVERVFKDQGGDFFPVGTAQTARGCPVHSQFWFGSGDSEQVKR